MKFELSQNIGAEKGTEFEFIVLEDLVLETETEIGSGECFFQVVFPEES